MLARRMVNLVSPFCTLAMGVAVPRYVAMAQNDSERRAFLLAGLRARRRPWPADWRPGHSAAQLGRETPPWQGTGPWPDNRCPLSTSSVTLFHELLCGLYRGQGRIMLANARFERIKTKRCAGGKRLAMRWRFAGSNERDLRGRGHVIVLTCPGLWKQDNQ